MSTRALVGIENPDGTIDYIYNHFDGYPSALGKHLLKVFDNEDLIRSLLANGDASSIEDAEFYRDRGEDAPMRTAKNMKEYLEEGTAVDYQYIWYRENDVVCEWMVTKGGKDEWKYLDSISL